MDNNVIEVTQFGAGVRTGTTAVYTVKPGQHGPLRRRRGYYGRICLHPEGRTREYEHHRPVRPQPCVAFAAEESRLTGRTVDVADFEKSVMA